MNAADAERAVLGTLLLTDRALSNLVVEEALRPEHFRSPEHQAIYGAMVALADNGESFDRGIVAAKLRTSADRQALDSISTAVSAAQVRSYARIVRDAHTTREVERVAREALSKVADGSLTASELRDRFATQAMDVGGEASGEQARNIAEAMSEQAERIHKISTGELKTDGVTSGFPDLDAITGGFRKGNLIVFAARPAMGKSAFITNVAENAAVAGATVLMFSMEMTDGEIAQRMIASEAHIKGDDLRDGRVRPEHWERIMAAGARMAPRKLLVDDTPDMSIMELRARARRVHQRTPLNMVIVDYLQLMRRPQGMSPVQAVGEMSRGLKILAKELDIPVIALSQLSRALETRGTDLKSKIPQLSDLRESGNIEQDADVVMFLFRPEKYEADERPGEADAIVSKHRGGPLGTATVVFLPEYLRFSSLGRR